MKKWMGKKQVLLGTLLVALGLAVYLNYRFAAVNPLQTTAGKATNVSVTATQSKNLGDSKFVSATTAPTGADYFASAKKNRLAARDEAVEIIEDILSRPTVTEEMTAQASAKLTALTDAIKEESDVETMLSAKGFSECLVFIDGDSAHVAVKTKELSEKQTVQILDVVTSQTGIAAENVNIVAIK